MYRNASKALSPAPRRRCLRLLDFAAHFNTPTTFHCNVFNVINAGNAVALAFRSGTKRPAMRDSLRREEPMTRSRVLSCPHFININPSGFYLEKPLNRNASSLIRGTSSALNECRRLSSRRSVPVVCSSPFPSLCCRQTI